MDILNPLPDQHLPDPPPVQGHSRHPRITVTWIVGGVLLVCLLLVIISIL